MRMETGGGVEQKGDSALGVRSFESANNTTRRLCMFDFMLLIKHNMRVNQQRIPENATKLVQ